MLRLLVTFILTLVAAYFLAWSGPWWLPLMACLLIAAWKFRRGWNGFFFGALVMICLWLGTAWYWNIQDTTGLSVKMAELFSGSLPAWSSLEGSSLIFIVLVLLAALLGGLAGLSGVYLKRLLFGSRQI